MMILERTSIDDPCASFVVHGISGAWGMAAVGIFGRKAAELNGPSGAAAAGQQAGLVTSGSWNLLWIQLLATAVIIVWSTTTTYILLKVKLQIDDQFFMRYLAIKHTIGKLQ